MASMAEDVFPIMKEAMFDLKDKNNTEVIWLNANKNEEQQEKDIDFLLKKKVDAIIINPVNSIKAVKLVKQINQKNIPVLALDRIIVNAKLAAYITANSFEVGMEQAKYLLAQIKETGKIIILKGDKSSNVAYEITAGNKEILRKNLKLDIIVEKWHKKWLAVMPVKKPVLLSPEGNLMQM